MDAPSVGVVWGSVCVWVTTCIGEYIRVDGGWLYMGCGDYWRPGDGDIACGVAGKRG